MIFSYLFLSNKFVKCERISGCTALYTNKSPCYMYNRAIEVGEMKNLKKS